MNVISLQQVIGDAQRKVLRLTAEISQGRSDILRKNPLEQYLKCLDSLPRVVSYNYISSDIESTCRQITGQGAPAMALYHKLVLASLIVRSQERFKSALLTDDVIHLFCQNFERILKAMDQYPPEFYQHSNDKFSKDLSVCLLRLIPMGAQKVNVNGIPRRIMIKAGPASGFGMFINILSEMGGFRPLYELHTDEHDSSALFEFTPDGWDRFYVRVAAMMELNKDIKGIFGISWFFDPQLERISPRLNFLRERPLQNGGRFFFVTQNKNGSGGALARSATRQRLFEKGEYIPANYILIWPRKQLIQWANSMKRDSAFIKKLNARSI